MSASSGTDAFTRETHEDEHWAEVADQWRSRERRARAFVGVFALVALGTLFAALVRVHGLLEALAFFGVGALVVFLLIAMLKRPRKVDVLPDPSDEHPGEHPDEHPDEQSDEQSDEHPDLIAYRAHMRAERRKAATVGIGVALFTVGLGVVTFQATGDAMNSFGMFVLLGSYVALRAFTGVR